MKRILHVLYSAAGGGVESVLYRYIKRMVRSKSNMQFDLAICGLDRSPMEERFETLGCRIFHLPLREDELSAHCRALREVFSQGRYAIVHSHQGEMGYTTLRIAEKYHVPTRILHGHSAFPTETFAQKVMRMGRVALGRHYATHLFACSPEAGEWFYGRRAVKSGRVYIMRNAFNLSRFAFDEDIRIQMREELQLGNALTVFCAARFEERKNHIMLLKVFEAVVARIPDAVLLLAGKGPLERKISERVKKMGLASNVRFLDVRTDVYRLMMAADVFVLPTLSEGHGTVLLEAQAAGLPALSSDVRGVHGVCLTELMHTRSLLDPPQQWAKEIVALAGQPRMDVSDALREAGYEIGEEASNLLSFYMECPDRR